MQRNKDLFCGVGPLPKGKRLGDAVYCSKTGQVQHFGVSKIPELLATYKKTKDSITKTESMLRELIRSSQSLRKNYAELRADLEDEDNERRRNKIKADIRRAVKKRDNLIEKMDYYRDMLAELKTEFKKSEAVAKNYKL